MNRPNYDKTTKRLLNKLMTKDSRKLEDNRVTKIKRDITYDMPRGWGDILLRAMGDVANNSEHVKIQ